MKRYLWMITLLWLGCTATEQQTTSTVFAFTEATEEVAIFGEGVISTADYVRDLAISPKGDELYFTLSSPRNHFSSIVFLKKENDQWSSPQIASFSGKYRDIEPAFSPDGNKLFFASNRSLNGQDSVKDYDIWMVERVGEKWGSPVNLGEVVNTSGNEFYPSVAENGNLYFTAIRPDTKGTEDIYVSKYQDGNYQTPESLSEAVNTITYEFNAFVAPDESYLIFSSYGRSDDLGGGDLYISLRDTEEQWQTAQHLGDKVNTPFLDYCPFVKNNTLYFTSDKMTVKEVYETPLTYSELVEIIGQPQNGLGNIYHIKFDALEL